MAIGNQPTQHIDKEIDRAAMAGILGLRDILELIDNTFDDGSFAQQQVVSQREQAVFHILAQLGDQLHIEGLEQVQKQLLGNVTPIAKEFSKQILRQLGHRLAIATWPGVRARLTNSPRSLQTRCTLKP